MARNAGCVRIRSDLGGSPTWTERAHMVDGSRPDWSGPGTRAGLNLPERVGGLYSKVCLAR